MIFETQEGSLLEWVLFKEGLEKKFFTLKRFKLELCCIRMVCINSYRLIITFYPVVLYEWEGVKEKGA